MFMLTFVSPLRADSEEDERRAKDTVFEPGKHAMKITHQMSNPEDKNVESELKRLESSITFNVLEYQKNKRRNPARDSTGKLVVDKEIKEMASRLAYAVLCLL